MEDMFDVRCSNENLDIKCHRRGEELIITAHNTGNRIEGCCIKATMKLPGIESAYTLFPGAIYDGNRADMIWPGNYPPRLKDFAKVNHEGPVIIGDIPGWKNGITVQTFDLTMPACGIYYDHEKRGIIFGIETGPVETPYGFTVDSDSVTLEFPCIRKSRYRHCGVYEQSHDKGIRFESNETKTFVIRVNDSGFIDRAEFSLAMTLMFKKQYIEREFRHEELVKGCIEKINRDDFNDDEGYYMDSGESRRFQVGWVSGLLTAYTMLLTDNPVYHERAVRTIRFVLDRGMSPSGLPFGIYDSKGFRGMKPYDPDGLDFSGTHVRRIYDAILYMFKITDLPVVNDSLKKELMAAAGSGCRCLFDMAVRYGHFGHSVDLMTGDILWGGSAAGITGISCLCKGYKAGGPFEWLEAATKAGEYYSRFNDRGYYNGGPGDILMAPDSESNYAAMEAFYLLYKTTGEERWKLEFQKAASLVTTWVCLQEYPFPEDSAYGRMGIDTTGLVMANSQNKHLGPGICTASAILFKHAWEFSGNEVFRDLHEIIRDAAAGIAIHFNGMIPEDINVSDSLCERGEFYEGHGIWTENAYILMNLEKHHE